MKRHSLVLWFAPFMALALVSHCTAQAPSPGPAVPASGPSVAASPATTAAPWDLSKPKVEALVQATVIAREGLRGALQDAAAMAAQAAGNPQQVDMILRRVRALNLAIAQLDASLQGVVGEIKQGAR